MGASGLSFLIEILGRPRRAVTASNVCDRQRTAAKLKCLPLGYGARGPASASGVGRADEVKLESPALQRFDA
ncbi:hypothetical protein GCM10010468_58780 [Actinocorallia longicatena]|uniref:Uncharacterized protein n=1 Tax=Actinocorallia longicatena TaxID=111803 RepID=A0ABP6QGI7_9ACTN